MKQRCETTFNHELIIDSQRYQPIDTTVVELNSKIEKFENGYIFLQGGPGTGKSSLLTQCFKNRDERIIKYYAFDFNNPASNLNNSDRGSTTSLFFDLVFQLKNAGFYKNEILPIRDSIFLRKVFSDQLYAIGEDYKKTGRKTILIIDGLDHIPREYKSVSDSFLLELPLPKSLPKGVFVILGSQSYELEDIPADIFREYKKEERTIKIDSLSLLAVKKYIDSSNICLSEEQNHKIFEKSQGHPLYLSYIVEKLQSSTDVEEAIDNFASIDGDIENYYYRIWKPIEKDSELIELLGYFSRINGIVNPEFVREWNIERDVLRRFREDAKFLFNDSVSGWTFFHNSFKQFLLQNTSKDVLTDEFDIEQNLSYHKRLVNFYNESTVEPLWGKNYHLFKSEQYDKFITEVSPDDIIKQFIDYRPIHEVKQDAKLGIEIAKKRNDVYILVRYLFVLSDLEKRLDNIDPASFTKEMLALGKLSTAKRYLRTENILHCNKAYALKTSLMFLEYGDEAEASILFNMSYPNFVTSDSIVIDDSDRYENIRSLIVEWISTAPYYMDTEGIILRIDNLQFKDESIQKHDEESLEDLQSHLYYKLSITLIVLNKWEELDIVLSKMRNLNKTTFPTIQVAIYG